jgi:Zn ribbon nucleic-acid-binding protein
MGSVLDYIECPNCKSEASSDYYYKTGEEYINCGNCGYHRSATIINRDKKLSELTEEDWNIEELKNPYGAYRIKVYHSIATQCGSFATKYEYDYFISEISKDVEIEFCSISRLVDGKIVTEILIDNGPEVDSAGYTAEDRQNENDLNALENSSPEY